MIRMEEITVGAKFWFIVFSLSWILIGLSALIFKVILFAIYIKSLLFVSSIFCFLYLVLGIKTKDFGESKEDYERRCKESELI